MLQGGAGAPESGRDTTTEDSAPENTKNKGPWNKPVRFCLHIAFLKRSFTLFSDYFVVCLYVY